MEAGKLELEKVVFVLPDLLQSLLETFSFQAREKGLEVDLDLDPDLPEFVIGDPGRIRQVLINLIGNAIKFTQSGTVTLEVSKVSLKGKRFSIKFAVLDTGCGIARKHQKEMFKAFTQADSGITRKFGGTGLGLNISSKLVKKMGGVLEVDSRPGEGSIFYFTARFDKAESEQVEQLKCHKTAVETREALSELDVDDLQILLVEDNKLNQRVAQGMLAKLGCKCDVAENGLEALARLREDSYDLVFMDLQMPEMDGLEAVGSLRRGKAGETNRQVPVIAMTAHASRQDRKNCLAAGMNDYVAKPVSTEQIGKAMLRVLCLAEGGEQETPSESFSMAKLIAQAEGDEGIAAEVMDQFMADTRKHLNLMIGALQHFDFDFAISEARSIEGGARKIHCSVIVGLVDELIDAAHSKQQEFALNLAEDIKAQLAEMESVI
jgi:CheY-like chemotaxis protein